jgi:hypothetical protein
MNSLPLRTRLAIVAGAFAPLLVAACISSSPNLSPSVDGGAFDLDGAVSATDAPADAAVDAAVDAHEAGPAGPVDSGDLDSAVDAGAFDSGTETGASDSGADTGALDSGTDAGAFDSGTDAGPSDAGIDSPAPDAGADAAPDASVSGVTYFVDPVSGLDTNTGLSAGAAFQSVSRAANVIDLLDAGAGPFTVQLAAGTYQSSNQTAMQPWFHNEPVAIVAPADGGTVFLGNGSGGEGFIFGKGGSVQNVTFKNTEFGVNAQSGTMSVAGCAFDGAGSGGYFAAFTGDTVGTLDTTAPTATITNVVYSSLGSVYVDNTANVTWYGGGSTTVTTTTFGSLVFARGGGQITVNRVNVNGWNGYVAVEYDQASVTLQGSTITNAGSSPNGAIWLGGSQSGVPSPSLTLTNTSLSGSLGNAVYVSTTTNTATVSLTISGSHLDGSAAGGLWVQGNTNVALAVNLNVTSSTFDNNGYWGIASPRATITFSGSGNSVSGNGATAAANGQTPGGVLLTDAASVNALTMRSAAVGGNTGDQISLTGTAASSLDLGTNASPGAVTFTGVGASNSAVNLGAAIAATAVGDNWLPNVQGSSSAGTYPASTTLTGPVTGQNATLVTGATLDVSP